MRRSFYPKNAALSVVVAILVTIFFGAIIVVAPNWLIKPSDATSQIPHFDAPTNQTDFDREAFSLEVKSLEEREVVRVVDGDTIVVRMDDGSEGKVRLIGIDAPESVNPDESKNTPEGELASNHLKELLYPGAHVWLSKDISDTDRFSRYLRFVWLEAPKDTSATPDEIDQKLLNAQLVSEGWAVAKKYDPDIACWSYLQYLQANAKQAYTQD